jgi:hypothetical protein
MIAFFIIYSVIMTHAVNLAKSGLPSNNSPALNFLAYFVQNEPEQGLDA